MAQILIAEDQSDLRDMMASSMRMEGHNVFSTANGMEALEKARETAPDLLILDIHLPQMSGPEICQQLKKTKALSALPILMISAEASPEEIEAGLLAGAGAFLNKPFSLENLVAHVNRLLG